MLNKKYKYLLCYGFLRKVGDELQYTESCTGRMFLNLTKKIKTQEDVYEVEDIIRKQISIDNIFQLYLYSFSLLK